MIENNILGKPTYNRFTNVIASRANRIDYSECRRRGRATLSYRKEGYRTKAN